MTDSCTNFREFLVEGTKPNLTDNKVIRRPTGRREYTPEEKQRWWNDVNRKANAKVAKGLHSGLAKKIARQRELNPDKDPQSLTTTPRQGAVMR
jgi:hypothetical protein